MTKKELSVLKEKENGLLAMVLKGCIECRDGLARLDDFYQTTRLNNYSDERSIDEYNGELARRRALVRIGYFRSCEVVTELKEAAKDLLNLKEPTK